MRGRHHVAQTPIHLNNTLIFYLVDLLFQFDIILEKIAPNMIVTK